MTPGPSTNLPINNIEETLDYFQRIYDDPVTVSQNQIDALYSFFISRTENEQTALALVYTVVVTAFSTKVNPMKMLDRFRKLDGISLDAELARFLNSSRNNTSMLGVKNTPKTNVQVSRTILS